MTGRGNVVVVEVRIVVLVDVGIIVVVDVGTVFVVGLDVVAIEMSAERTSKESSVEFKLLAQKLSTRKKRNCSLKTQVH